MTAWTRTEVLGSILMSMTACIATSIGVLTDTAYAQAVHDSSGVKIITFSTTDTPREQWRIERQPLVSIGAVGGAGPTELWMVAGVVCLPDGSVVIADGGSMQIRVFDSNGNHRQTFGGRGNGPGEFPALWSLWQVDDRFVGVDGGGRAQVFTFNGEYVRTEQRPSSPSGRRIRRRGYLGDGSLIGQYSDRSEASSDRPSISYMTLVKLNDTQQAIVGRFPAYDKALSKGESTFVVYGARGHVVVLNNTVCVGYSEEYSFLCMDASGTPLIKIERPGQQGRRVNQADEQAYFDGIDIANPGQRGAAYRREVRETTVFADRFPPYGRFVASTNEELWVGPLVPADETLGTLNPSPPGTTIWSVYSTDGEWLSEVTLPPRFRLMTAGPDYVAGVERDDNDVEHVVVFEIRKT